MRLSKYLARAGLASRRRAENLIREGRVEINEKVVTLPQTEVLESDSVSIDGNTVNGYESKCYLLLNKPSGYISTVHDTHNRPTVTALLKGISTRVYPVGRLDADTRGVLLLTNDGELAYRLTHPRYGVEKVYRVRVRGLAGEKALSMLRSGVIIDHKKAAPLSAVILEINKNTFTTLFEIILTEGRKRQVKKMCAALGYPVIELERVKFAGLTAANLAEGSYRTLSSEEIEHLYRTVGLRT